jgi:hypothetical protein
MMKALRTTICAYAIALLVSFGFVSSALAGSAEFGGIFGALHVSMNGAEINGSHTTGKGDSEGGGTLDESTKGRLGAVIPVAGYELGFNLPLGDVFFLGIGGTMINGSAEFVEGDDFDNSADFTLEISDAKTYYIQPSISIYDNSAIYVKLGRTMADLTAIGDVTGAPNNLQGNMYAIGTTTMANNGLFIKTELGGTDFDQISLVGVGGSAEAQVEGNPIMAHGSLTIGYKF